MAWTSPAGAQEPPKPVEKVGEARWTPSLGFTSPGEPIPDAPPPSGAVMLEEPPPTANAPGNPDDPTTAAAGAGDASGATTAEGLNHLDAVLGVSVFQPTNYGTDDVLLNQAGFTAGAALGFRWPVAEAFGLTLDFALDYAQADFDTIAKVDVLKAPASFGGVVTLFSAEELRLEIAGNGYVGAGFSSASSDTGTFDGEAWNAFGGGALSTLFRASIFGIEPTYRWLHTGVDAHYLGGKLSFTFTPALRLSFIAEQRIAAFGGVATANNFADAFFKTAPTKTYGAVALTYLF